MDIPFDYGTIGEAADWAYAAKQCKCCEAWALLDESDKCYQCRTGEHKHPQIVITW